MALLGAAILFLAWGLGLVLAPEPSHGLISRGPYDPVPARMLGAMFLAWALTALLAARSPVRDLVRAVAAGTLIVALVAAYLMFIGRGMPVRDTNLVSLVAALAAAGLLIYLEVGRDTRPERRREGAHRRAPSQPARAGGGRRRAAGAAVAKQAQAKKPKKAKKAGPVRARKKSR